VRGRGEERVYVVRGGRGVGEDEEQEEVKPLCVTWSRGNRIHQSPHVKLSLPSD